MQTPAEIRTALVAELKRIKTTNGFATDITDTNVFQSYHEYEQASLREAENWPRLVLLQAEREYKQEANNRRIAEDAWIIEVRGIASESVPAYAFVDAISADMTKLFDRNYLTAQGVKTRTEVTVLEQKSNEAVAHGDVVTVNFAIAFTYQIA